METILNTKLASNLILTTKSLRNALLFIPLSILISSCGGGGSGGDKNSLPASNAGADQSVEESTLVTLTGAGSDADGTVASYSWSQVSGSYVSIQNSDTATATFTAPNILTEEVLLFRLTVTDNDGGSVTDAVNIRVIPNIFPVANAGADADFNERTLVTLTGSGTDSDGTINGYFWEQINGTPVTLDNADTVSASFTAPSTDLPDILEFQLTVTDNDGDASIDQVTINVIPVFYEITLSDVKTDCGNAVAEDVDLYFYDVEGNQDAITINHTGVEQTYFIDPIGIEDGGIVKIVKGGQDVVIVEADRSVPLYMELTVQGSFFCDCPTYNITLENEPTANPSQTNLVIAGRAASQATTEVSDRLIWSDVRICNNQENSVYIVDRAIHKVTKLAIDSDVNIVVNGLSDMAMSVLDPDISIPHLYSQAYTLQDSSDKLMGAFDTGSYNENMGVLYYPDLESITDIAHSFSIDTNFVDLQISEMPSFTLGIGNEVSIDEHYSSINSREDMAAGLEFDLFEIESLNVDVLGNRIDISSANDLSFDASVIYVFSSGVVSSEIIAPIKNGVVDLSLVEDAISGFDSFMILFLLDYDGIDSYQDAVKTFYRRKITGESVQSRSIRIFINLTN